MVFECCPYFNQCTGLWVQHLLEEAFAFQIKGLDENVPEAKHKTTLYDRLKAIGVLNQNNRKQRNGFRNALRKSKKGQEAGVARA